MRVVEHRRAGSDKRLDQCLVHQLLITLKDRERIDTIFSRDIADGGKGIAFLYGSCCPDLVGCSQFCGLWAAFCMIGPGMADVDTT